ncbi:hypothetical protein GRI47_11520 [Erythrobacter pelagi]|uniref:Uncharacterized protein n=1 Tax=Qipengyuania pelagi TaxID=994320 RepID=A0A844YB32_9SPHN|nr:hypothetical protein [Qipengyuania pelagi]MXO54629.1 hypothetical protein [Qipengyuania pelagi]
MRKLLLMSALIFISLFWAAFGAAWGGAGFLESYRIKSPEYPEDYAVFVISITILYAPLFYFIYLAICFLRNAD